MANQLKIDKPLRLIELFAGIGAQAKALENLGVKFEHYRICEFDNFAVTSYNAVHGTDFITSDITKITADDLGIVDTDKYTYLMTYSFPCQDLSLAGNRNGMSKDSGTRSGLLWEVERLLNESKELPQILLMENVPQVISDSNMKDFSEWLKFLESKGYSNKYQILNAKDYGVPQHRKRCFMVSWLGNYWYEFPKGSPLSLRLKDLLESDVPEKYYLSDAILDTLSHIDNPTNTDSVDRIGGLYDKPNKKHQIGSIYSINGFSPPLDTAQGGNHTPLIQLGTLVGGRWDNMHECVRRVYDTDGLCPTITAPTGGNHEPKIGEEVKCKQVDITQLVKVRKHEVDIKGLQEVLRSHRIYNCKDISTLLNVPLTKVEHWFRTDDYFAIPDNDIWLKLKKLLKIDTDEFDASIMEFDIRPAVFDSTNRAYETDGLAVTVTAGNVQNIVERTEPFIVASRGRNPDNPSDRTAGVHLEQRIEPNELGIANTVTTVQKDNYLVEPCTETKQYRIRKLTPRECWRLMGFDDNSFNRVKWVDDKHTIEQMSDSQLYKQAGNSIVVDVLMAIFKPMFNTKDLGEEHRNSVGEVYHRTDLLGE